MSTDTNPAPANGLAPNPPQHYPAGVAPASTFYDGPINILIVDDEPKNLTVLETVLDDPGYRLVRASSADEALLALVVDEFALLILDIRMPGMTGFELAQMIKERKKTARVPIIFLTAYYNEDQHVLEGYGTGAVDYLHKPVNPAILRSKVAVFAELHRKSRESSLANRALLAEVTERRRVEDQLRELNETLERRVTERTDALKEVDRRKDEFLAMLAHELRNPLAPIRNAVQILQLTGLREPTVDGACQMIDRQVNHLVRLVDDLLDVSRVSLGKIRLNKELLNLAVVVQQALDTSRPLIDVRRHQLTLTLSPESVWVEGDFTRLAQMISNLLNNAAKYTEVEGSIWLTVEKASGGNDGPEEAVIRVRDTGRGIDPPALKSLFDMFYQADHNLDRSDGGLGIGLSLVKRLAEMHGGRVEAHSAGRGKGSEFIVRLPLIQETLPAVADRPAIATPIGRPIRILIVDDNRDSTESMAILLKIEGHEVLTAHDGKQAVEIAVRERPGAILLDIGLPYVDGYQACRAMRDGGLTDALIVAMTGYGQEEDRRQAQEAGFDAHLVKPVNLSSIRELLAHRAAERLAWLSEAASRKDSGSERSEAKT